MKIHHSLLSVRSPGSWKPPIGSRVPKLLCETDSTITIFVSVGTHIPGDSYSTILPISLEEILG